MARQPGAGADWLRVAALLAIPAALMTVPTRVIASGPRLCLSRLLLRRACPGCGMTRAVSCALHGDLRGAWRNNPRIVVVLPLLAALWAREVRRLAARL